MPDFLARIELVNLPEGDNRDIYEELHAQMEAQGFSRQLNTSIGLRWLPDATYWYSGNVTKSDVLAKAKAAVASTKQSARYFVAQVSDFTSNNLLPVEEGKGKG
jgi:hypothetical protein